MGDNQPLNFGDAIAVLGVDLTASDDEVRRAYLRRLTRCKPERDPRGFMRLREAYDLVREQIGWRWQCEQEAWPEDDGTLHGQDDGALHGQHGVAELPRRALARGRLACEQAKRRLTTAEQTRIAVAGLELPGRAVDVELGVSRDQAEALWQPLLDRVRGPIRRALRDATLRAEQIDEVLLVGGATRMPCLVRLATRQFGRLPLRGLPPDEAVAMGAAVQAALKQGEAAVDDLVATDVAPFTLGVSTGEKMGDRLVDGIFTPILERGTVIPASRVKSLATLDDFQSEVVVSVYQGEHATCERNQSLGTYTIKGIPKAPAGEQTVDVRFTYDLNGMLEVETTIPATGRTATMVIQRGPNRLTEADVARATRAMARLKFHPRDALPNTTAVARAEALYVELTGMAREALGSALAQFRLALEGQDPQQIAAARQQLAATTRELSREP